jgi:hypothetical protein
LALPILGSQHRREGEGRARENERPQQLTNVEGVVLADRQREDLAFRGWRLSEFVREHVETLVHSGVRCRHRDLVVVDRCRHAALEPRLLYGILGERRERFTR